MSIFLIETDALSETGKSVFNSSQELLDLSEKVGNYSVENDTFDFATAKNTIAANLNKMQIRMSNVAQVLSYTADTHTSVQNSMKCTASEGLEIKNSTTSPGTTKPADSPETTTTPATTQPTTPSNNSNPSAGTDTPSTTVPPANNNTPETKPSFVNYYQKDYSELTENSSSVVTAGGASTAVAMVLTAINAKEISPVETTKWGLDNKAGVPNEQGEITYFDNIAKAYGIECESMDLTKENILKNISEGKYMIISMDEGKFGNKGNYVVITGITEDGKIKIADPNSTDNSEKVWDLSVFLEEGLKLWGFSKPVEKSS